MLMMIRSLTQERREDILSRLTPTTCNIVKQSSHHAQNMQQIHHIVKRDTHHLRYHQAIQNSGKFTEPTEIIHNIKLSSHYNFKIKDQVDIVILVFMIGRPTLNRRPLLIWLSISREDSATVEKISVTKCRMISTQSFKQPLGCLIDWWAQCNQCHKHGIAIFLFIWICWRPGWFAPLWKKMTK